MQKYFRMFMLFQWYVLIWMWNPLWSKSFKCGTRWCLGKRHEKDRRPLWNVHLFKAIPIRTIKTSLKELTIERALYLEVAHLPSTLVKHWFKDNIYRSHLSSILSNWKDVSGQKHFTIAKYLFPNENDHKALEYPKLICLFSSLSHHNSITNW